MKIFIKPSDQEIHATYGMEHRAYTTNADRKRAITMFKKSNIQCIDYRDVQAEYALIVYRKSWLRDIMDS